LHIQCQILEVAHFAGILLGILVCGDPSNNKYVSK
jgi:hypothetical protein